jgi:branched-subunit amino acid aminotransferase/4-amino-4-deoxychorismate lyase
VTGLIETVRVRAGAAPLWPLHRARLSASAAELGLEAGAVEMPQGGPDRIVRIEVRREGMSVSERPVPPPVPVRLIVSAEPYQPYPHKVTDRGQFDRALAEAASAGADDAVLLAEGGVVAEAARWGIYWWDGGRLCAPPMGLGLLRSVARVRVAELAGPIEERAVAAAALAGHSLFAANAARGIVEVVTWNGHASPRDARTDALAGRFWP